MFPWVPRHIPADFIPVFRTLGRKMKWADHTHIRTDLPDFISNVTRQMCFGDNLSLKEQQLLRYSDPTNVYCLGKVLADGVKMFELPSDFLALDEIEIPLMVRDYAQPFPAVVVKSADEYHFVVNESETLIIGTYSHTQKAGDFEFSTMMDPNRKIESYLTDSMILNGKADNPILKITNEPDAFRRHRFRATLNFLLLTMLEGIVEKPTPGIPKHLKTNPISRLAKPRVYVPQNIEVLKTRYSAAVRPEGISSEQPGLIKRPHWRRAHWRRVPVGVGRTERRLTFIRASFIHKELVGALDKTKSVYKVSPTRANELMQPPQSQVVNS